MALIIPSTILPTVAIWYYFVLPTIPKYNLTLYKPIDIFKGVYTKLYSTIDTIIQTQKS